MKALRILGAAALSVVIVAGVVALGVLYDDYAASRK